MSDIVERVADVFEDHQYNGRAQDFHGKVHEHCICGWNQALNGVDDEPHNLHLAQAVLDALQLTTEIDVLNEHIVIGEPTKVATRLVSPWVAEEGK